MTIQPEKREKNYRWIFTVILLDGKNFGYSFIFTTTILPLFISKCTSSLVTTKG